MIYKEMKWEKLPQIDFEKGILVSREVFGGHLGPMGCEVFIIYEVDSSKYLEIHSMGGSLYYKEITGEI